MKRCFVVIAAFVVAAGLTACGGSRPSDVLEKMQSVYSSDRFEDAAQYYTKGTVEAMNELNKIAPKSGKEEGLADRKFMKDAKWTVVDEKIIGDTAEVKVKYTEHPVENMKGFEYAFRMKKEDGRWKIDMEQEMKSAISMIRQMNTAGGMMEKLRSFVK